MNADIAPVFPSGLVVFGPWCILFGQSAGLGRLVSFCLFVCHVDVFPLFSVQNTVLVASNAPLKTVFAVGIFTLAIASWLLTILASVRLSLTTNTVP